MDKDLKRMEIQANKFAGLFLMPELPLAYQFEYSKQKNDIRYKFLYLGNTTDCKRVFSDLSAAFGVSKDAVRYRLIKMKFCIEEDIIGQAGGIIRRI